MFTSDYWHREYICPFWQAAGKKTIRCEGECVLAFPERRETSDYITRAVQHRGGETPILRKNRMRAEAHAERRMRSFCVRGVKRFSGYAMLKSRREA